LNQRFFKERFLKVQMILMSVNLKQSFFLKNIILFSLFLGWAWTLLKLFLNEELKFFLSQLKYK